MRDLPYPYRNYLSIGSDCDSQSLEDARRLKNVVRDEMGLNLSDSFFPNTDDRGLAPFRNCAPREGEPGAKEEFFDFIKRSHSEGWLDHIHGVTENFYWTGWAPMVLKGGCDGDSDIVDKPFEATSGHRDMSVGVISFDVWLSENVKSFEIHFRDSQGREHWIVPEGELGDRSGWEFSRTRGAPETINARLNCSKEMNAGSPCSFFDVLTVSVEWNAGSGNDECAVLANFMFANYGRRHIEDILNGLAAAGLNISTCSSHGQVFNIGTMGNDHKSRFLLYKNWRLYKKTIFHLKCLRENRLAGGDRRSAPRLLALARANEYGDNPNSPFYHADLLKKFEIRYLRFNHDTHTP